VVLTRMSTTAAAAANGVPNREITFKYDHLGRRVQKRVVDLNGGGGSWVGTDIGITGGSHNEGPPFTVTAAGSDIWGTSDEFRFVHQQMTGDGTVMATVTGLGNTDPWAKAGLMIRESLSANARNAMVLVTPSNNSAFQYRSTTGGSSSSTAGPYTWMPARLRLVRTGNTITGSISQDGGSTWTQVGSITLSGLPSTVYVGLAVTSHNTGTATTGTFENISVPSSGGATEASSRRYLYDGWNLIAEFNAPGGTSIGSLVRSYTWGLDIVHSLTSAGGVGALLQIADHATGKTYLPGYDANGNVASLVNADTGATAAAYEYSPFGEPLRSQTIDSTIADQPFRFSTKFTDLETGLVYYGRRYYDPLLGRFICRDPKEELGGLNLYGFVGNNAMNRWDYLGMCEGEEDEDDDASWDDDGYGGLDVAVYVDGVRTGSMSSSSTGYHELSRVAGSSSTPDPTTSGQPTNGNTRFGNLPSQVVNPQGGVDVNNAGNMTQTNGAPIQMTPFKVNENTVPGAVNPDFASVVGAFAECSSALNSAATLTQFVGENVLLLMNPASLSPQRITANLAGKATRKKPGTQGEFKSSDALRAENKKARDAAREAGLNKDQERRFHEEISGQGITDYDELVEMAKQFKGGGGG
jgi:RHS repeat-associated protein